MLSRLRSTRCFTLFPYTSLFRSELDERRLPGAVLADERDGRARRKLEVDSCEDVGLCLGIPEQRPTSSHESTSDRKSTRLNSSHLGISYAAFCLKKKKYYKGHNA